MDREKLKQVAGYYFFEVVGMEPDKLEFERERLAQQEYTLRVEAGRQTFQIVMCPPRNKITLTEIRHAGTFAEAAALAGHEYVCNNK